MTQAQQIAHFSQGVAGLQHLYRFWK